MTVGGTVGRTVGVPDRILEVEEGDCNVNVNVILSCQLKNSTRKERKKTTLIQSE